jgi:peptidoglycan/LPS O-acetylase OafA/YrhL
MLRGILAVVVGYLAIGAWTMLVLSLAWSLLGASFAFQEGTFRVSAAWIVLLFPITALGAALGGLVAALLGKSPTNRPVNFLAGVVLLAWLVMAVIHVMVEEPDKEVAGAPEPEAMTGRGASSEAVYPTWYNFTIPFVGMIAVVMGGRLGRRKEDVGRSG